MWARAFALLTRLPATMRTLGTSVRKDGLQNHLRQQAIRPPRNSVVAIGVIGVFALFAAYEYAMFSQHAAQKQAFIDHMMQSDVVGQATAPIEVEALKAAANDFALSNGPDTQMMPHFLVLGSVLLVVLLLIWQRQGGGASAAIDQNADDARTNTQVQMEAEQRAMRQKLLEEKFRAEAASRAKTSFLAHLSHDVRTPLNHIIGFADMISHETYGPLGDARYLNYIKDIKTSGERLLGSFTDIMELAQIEGGQLTLRKEPMTVESAMDVVANRFNDAARRANITFEVSTPQDALLYCDRICIERMLGNIVQNAIQFTPAGGRIFMAGWVAEDGVVIEVSDSGIGIPEERLKELSQPFALGDAAFTRETKGVGLGIAISRAIAELSGGLMEIDSNPAVGTTVAICLPRHKEAAKSQAA